MLLSMNLTGTLKYAAYWVGINEEYIAVITADESDVLSGISKITQNSMMVYASSVIFWLLLLYSLPELSANRYVK